MSRPSKAIRPPRGWRKPKTVFSSVDLPAPFGPMIPVSEPAYRELHAIEDVDPST
jgi:hypothetical protein